MMHRTEIKMAVIPTMMVLYTNDAVEVRYSDGSRLQLSACGASMFHADPPTDLSHPLADNQGVQKWTQFVTSAHRDKVIQALDFRNRFAQRPFLCSSLIPAEDIVSLHAQVDKALWPKMPEDADVEILADGSKRTVSMDEYASIVISPHGQDYTVCFLSRISEDVTNSRDQVHAAPVSSDRNFVNNGVRSAKDELYLAGCPQKLVENHSHSSGQEGSYDYPKCKMVEPSDGAGDAAVTHRPMVDGIQNSADELPSCEEEQTLEASGLILSEGTMSTPGRNIQQCDLQTSAASLIHHDISSISRVSTPDGLRGMVDCDETLPEKQDSVGNQDPFSVQFLHSSPVSQSNVPHVSNQGYVLLTSEIRSKKNEETEAALECSVPGVRSSTPQENENANLSGEGVANKGNFHNSPESDCAGRVIERKASTNIPKTDNCSQAVSHGAQEADKVKKTNTQVPVCEESSQVPVDHGVAEQTGADQYRHYVTPMPDRDGQVTERGATSCNRQRTADTWSGVRHYYTWVTQHVSHSECTAVWRHPLRLMQHTDPSDLKCNLSVSTNVSKGFQIPSAVDAEHSVSSPLPPPLPLTCRFQHQHAWQPCHRDVDLEGLSPQGAGEFKQGHFKVIMMEGVVYRFVEVAKLKVVEIYPGDGSVFASQGLTGHFFSHIMWKHGKLEEKTYSVGTFPPASPKLPYSVEKLVKRANRFLTGCIQNSKLSQTVDLPCWKQMPLQVVEPLSVSILEECRVLDYGRFTAYTNGRVRILFDDRTALNMMSDFSHRLEGCLKHSNYSEPGLAEKVTAVTGSGLDWQLGSHQCQLLLPSGRYVTVELQAPGLFRKYTEAAKEWIKWVQSSPKERRHFYHQKPDSGATHMSAEAELRKIERFNYIINHTGSGIVDPSQVPDSLSGNLRAATSLCPASSSSYRHAPYSSQHSLGVKPTHTETLPNYPLSVLSNPKDLELVEGFSHAREALLRTSQMIKDIDDIVKECKKTL